MNAAKKKTKHRTKVCYFGEHICVYDLCEIAELQVKTFLRRWNAAMRPQDITLLGELLKRSARENPSMLTVVDGDVEIEMTIKRATEVFMTSDYTIRRRIEKYGWRIAIENMRVNISMRDKCRRAGKQAHSSEWSRLSGRNREIKVEDSSMGWAERKYFPSAGQSGFSKSPKAGINAHCDRCTILPILNGD